MPLVHERRIKVAGKNSVGKASGGHKRRPALTLEAEENEMVALAHNLARQQLLDGTASSQIITHYLKIGSTREKLEKEILEKKKDVMDAQIKEIESSEDVKKMMEEAMNAFKGYAMPSVGEQED